MLNSDDLVFVWAIGRALLIVLVSCGTLVYLAWAVTLRRNSAAHVEISNHKTLKCQGSGKEDGGPLITDATAGETEGRSLSGSNLREGISVHNPKRPIAAA